MKEKFVESFIRACATIAAKYFMAAIKWCIGFIANKFKSPNPA